jgi:actin-related protein 3
MQGGSTLFRNFDRRLQMEVQRTVDARLSTQSSGVPVRVHSDPLQHCAVWFGGSLLSTTPGFDQVCRTKAEYEEYGPSICRSNATSGNQR